ncbi:hypothetical protein TNCT_599871 [Trichonephila clavata]|uniref:Uncharacterized protein n=1 Tax=Trichonephila clavata TaxID=2740835 RepID=A0A8X6H428_TRICU|nr:hypothetical protein TNCT_599871 [Trichonephila clavata]
MLSFSGKKSRGEQRTGPVFVGMVSQVKGMERVKFVSISGKNVEEGKEQGLCSTGQGKEATVPKESNGGVLSNGGTQRSTINKVKAW